jgi:hypothetical protein
MLLRTQMDGNQAKQKSVFSMDMRNGPLLQQKCSGPVAQNPTFKSLWLTLIRISKSQRASQLFSDMDALTLLGGPKNSHEVA